MKLNIADAISLMRMRLNTLHTEELELETTWTELRELAEEGRSAAQEKQKLFDMLLEKQLAKSKRKE